MKESDENALLEAICSNFDLLGKNISTFEPPKSRSDHAALCADLAAIRGDLLQARIKLDSKNVQKK